MEREQIKELLRDVFGRSVYYKDLGEWVSVKCPLAPWTHAKGQDNLPSSGIAVNPDDTSIFNCLSCGFKAPISALLRRYADYSGENLDDLIYEVDQGEFLGPRSIAEYDQILANRMVTRAVPLDESIYMDLYASAHEHPYLKRRGISKATGKKLELLYDPRDPVDGEPRILFPVRGLDGLLYGFSGRATREGARLKVRDYYGFKKAQNVLGAHFMPSAKRTIVVEGLFDYAAVHELGECGCAIMHASMTDDQASIVREAGKPTFILYDKDKAGTSGVRVSGKLLKDYVPTFKCPYPSVRIADRSKLGWHWLKDPGEMVSEDLAYSLENAVMV